MLVFLCFGGGDFTAVVLIYSGGDFFGWIFLRFCGTIFLVLWCFCGGNGNFCGDCADFVVVLVVIGEMGCYFGKL